MPPSSVVTARLCVTTVVCSEIRLRTSEVIWVCLDITAPSLDEVKYLIEQGSAQPELFSTPLPEYEITQQRLEDDLPVEADLISLPALANVSGVKVYQVPD